LAFGKIRFGTILALLVLVTVVPLGLFAGRLILVLWQQQLDMVNRQSVERAHAIAITIDQEVQKTITALNVLATLERIEGDFEDFYDAAARMVPAQPGWQSVQLLEPSSTVLLDTSVAFGQTPLPLDVGDLIKKIKATGGPAASPARKDPRTGQWTVRIGVPVTSGGRLRYVVCANVLTAEFSDVLRRQKTPPDSVLSLLDDNLTIMARSRSEEIYLGGRPTPDFEQAIRSSPEGSRRSQMLEGTPSYAAYSRSPMTGWTVGLGLPRETVDGPIRESLKSLVRVGGALLGSGIFLAFLVRRRVVRAQVAALDAARALARGETVAMPQSAVVEFDALANGLREAAAISEQRLRERDQAEQARGLAAENLERALAREHAARVAGERNEARLSVTLQSIGDAVIATDADGLVTVLNPVAQALTGWSEGDAIGSPIDKVFATLDERTREPRANPLTALDEGGARSADALLVAKSGRELPIGDSAAPIRTPDGTLLGIVVVFRDVTAERNAERHRTSILEREQAARQTAEALSRAKDEFVATVSHELRTPLNAIFGWVAMLKLGSLDADGRGKALDVIDRNTRLQAQLIEDLLDMARVIRGTVRLEMQPVDLAAVVDLAADTVKPAADVRRVRMTVHSPRGVALVSGDPSRLQQIVWNLLSNSIKFSAAGADVNVRLEQDGDDAVLRVRDTGIGIDQNFLPYVFERFRQESSDVTREHAGLGLGLSLVRHLVELHGGSVSAASEGKTKGAAFTVRLPLLGARAAPGAATDQASETLTSEALYSTQLQGLGMLLVDDDPEARELLAVVFGQAGARVSAAGSVNEAIAMVEAAAPDIVLTDIAMPHATGFDLLRELRGDPRWAGIPVIAVTAYARSEDRVQALSAGFNAHVAKPLSPRALVAMVAELARR
jgi:PAS domain S-box-containing protein